METTIASNTLYLAVLPLQVLSGDSRVEMFCQGLVMDLITDCPAFALSRSLHTIP